ncbi:phosphoribosylglycinamide formyltransferase [Peribacillus sp. SCS-155]|uniref:phosphoribosylglycinamide formyltransferase n=1 Tax=Peribacillus sedimenti TaxID=3115297 RepID=UPI00390663EA
MKQMAVFASGNGSNFQALVDAIKSGSLQTELSLLVCDNKNAFVLERALAENIKVFVFDPKQYETKSSFEKEILRELAIHDIDWIVLAGYMRLIGPTLLSKYSGRIINIHPSLLPSFPGKDAIGQALQAGVGTTGVTVHYVDEGMDTGTVISQREVPILSTDSKDSLQKRIQAVEHELYPAVLAELLRK